MSKSTDNGLFMPKFFSITWSLTSLHALHTASDWNVGHVQLPEVHEGLIC